MSAHDVVEQLSRKLDIDLRLRASDAFGHRKDYDDWVHFSTVVSALKSYFREYNNINLALRESHRGRYLLSPKATSVPPPQNVEEELTRSLSVELPLPTQQPDLELEFSGTSRSRAGQLPDLQFLPLETEQEVELQGAPISIEEEISPIPLDVQVVGFLMEHPDFDDLSSDTPPVISTEALVAPNNPETAPRKSYSPLHLVDLFTSPLSAAALNPTTTRKIHLNDWHIAMASGHERTEAKAVEGHLNVNALRIEHRRPLPHDLHLSVGFQAAQWSGDLQAQRSYSGEGATLQGIDFELQRELPLHWFWAPSFASLKLRSPLLSDDHLLSPSSLQLGAYLNSHQTISHGLELSTNLGLTLSDDTLHLGARAKTLSPSLENTLHFNSPVGPMGVGLLLMPYPYKNLSHNSELMRFHLQWRGQAGGLPLGARLYFDAGLDSVGLSISLKPPKFNLFQES